MEKEQICIVTVDVHAMETHPNICESCKTRPVELLEQPDKGLQPYRLCTQCHNRLINYALRPLEFFNLATIHGYGYYLHDDLYEYNTGKATQPELDVEEPEDFPFPDLQAIKAEPEKLIDYACVQYYTSDEVIELLKQSDKTAVLEYMRFEVDYNRSINYKAYEIAAKVLGSYAEGWVQQQWNERKENELLIFTPALAACLPFHDAFEIVINEVEQSDDKSITYNSYALLYFQSSRTLLWIEKVKDRIKNVSSTWGVLAAASKFDWQTAKKWLDDGRPLSLIALDALIYCTTIGERLNQPLSLREHPQTLIDAARPEDIANTLTAYLEKDRVPRAKGAVRQITNNLYATDL